MIKKKIFFNSIKFFLLFLLFSTAQAAQISLKEQLRKAEPNSWLVSEQNKNYTFFYIRENNGEHVIIEEVTMSASKRPPKSGFNWRDWFESGAKGHTLWTMSQINLNTGQFENSFSFTHCGWLDLSKSSTFFTTLLNLNFQTVPLEQRRRVGLAPSHRKQDKRPLWQPRLVVNGCRVANPTFYAYKTRWPADRSELSRKWIEVYIPEQKEGAHYPTYFPYWLEVEGKIGSAKVRVVDSGMQATSPKSDLPQRY